MKPRIVLRGRALRLAEFSPFRPELERLEARTVPGSLFDSIALDPFPWSSTQFSNPETSPSTVLARRSPTSSDESKAPNAETADPLQSPLTKNELKLSIDRRAPFVNERGVPTNPPVQPGTSGVDSPTSVNGTDKLEPPTGLTGGVIQSDGSYVDIKLKWEYNDIGAKLFHIDRSTAPTNHALIAKVDYHEDIDVTHYQYIDRRVPQGPTYYYWVKAVNGLNQSPWSEMFTVPTA